MVCFYFLDHIWSISRCMPSLKFVSPNKLIDKIKNNRVFLIEERWPSKSGSLRWKTKRVIPIFFGKSIDVCFHRFCIYFYFDIMLYAVTWTDSLKNDSKYKSPLTWTKWWQKSEIMGEKRFFLLHSTFGVAKKFVWCLVYLSFLFYDFYRKYRTWKLNVSWTKVKSTAVYPLCITKRASRWARGPPSPLLPPWTRLIMNS